MKRALIPIALILTSCGPEVDPFRCAPASPVCEWQVPAKNNPGPPPCFDLACTLMPEDDSVLTLPEMIDLALANSTATRRTWARARIAAAEYGMARSEFYPEIDIGGQAESYRTSTFFGSGSLITEQLVQYGPQLTLNWILFNFGATAAKAGVMREQLVAANFIHSREVQTVVDQVMVDYYTYMGNLEQVRASLANLRDGEINLEASIVKWRAGVTDRADELMAQAQVSQLELELLSNEQMMADSLTQLSQDLGLPAQLPLEFQGLPATIPVNEVGESVDELVAAAYQQRPDLFAALAKLRSARQFLKEAKAVQMPAITLSGDTSRDYFNSGQASGIDYTATLNVQIPLFRGFYYQNKVRKAKAEIEQAKAGVRELLVSISADVVTEYNNFIIAGKKVEAGEIYVESAEGSYQASLQKYKAGTTDFTTLADSLARLADARAALVLARQDWYTSLTNLAYALGAVGRRCP